METTQALKPKTKTNKKQPIKKKIHMKKCAEKRKRPSRIEISKVSKRILTKKWQDMPLWGY